MADAISFIEAPPARHCFFADFFAVLLDMSAMPAAERFSLHAPPPRRHAAPARASADAAARRARR